MLGRSVGIAAICTALGATAFILPPGIAPASNRGASDLIVSIANPKSQLITIPCSECVFPVKEEKVEDVADEEDFFWIQGGANSLVLNFTVTEDGRDLNLNGNHIYPPQFGQSLFEKPTLYVKQVPSSARLEDVASGDVRSADLEVTAYGLKSEQETSLTTEGDVLSELKLQILGLENEMMNVGEVDVKLLKTGAGELLIMQVEAHPTDKSMFEGLLLPPPPDMQEDAEFLPPPPPPPPSGPHPHKECKMLPAPLCKLRNMIESKIMALGHGGTRPKKHPCPGRKGGPDRMFQGHLPPPPHGHEAGPDGHPRPHHGRPHHMRPHGPHHGHFKHHFFHAFAKGLVAVLIPVMAGITVGITVSLVGLIVGRLIGFLWIKLARGGRRGTANVTHEEAAVEEGEDKAMLAEMEAPPVYEDAPAYEAVEKDEK